MKIESGKQGLLQVYETKTEAYRITAHGSGATLISFHANQPDLRKKELHATGFSEKNDLEGIIGNPFVSLSAKIYSLGWNSDIISDELMLYLTPEQAREMVEWLQIAIADTNTEENTS